MRHAKPCPGPGLSGPGRVSPGRQVVDRAHRAAGGGRPGGTGPGARGAVTRTAPRAERGGCAGGLGEATRRPWLAAWGCIGLMGGGARSSAAWHADPVAWHSCAATTCQCRIAKHRSVWLLFLYCSRSDQAAVPHKPVLTCGRDSDMVGTRASWPQAPAVPRPRWRLTQAMRGTQAAGVPQARPHALLGRGGGRPKPLEAGGAAAPGVSCGQAPRPVWAVRLATPHTPHQCG
jgi:hypothetical protein